MVVAHDRPDRSTNGGAVSEGDTAVKREEDSNPLLRPWARPYAIDGLRLVGAEAGRVGRRTGAAADVRLGAEGASTRIGNQTVDQAVRSIARSRGARIGGGDLRRG